MSKKFVFGSIIIILIAVGVWMIIKPNPRVEKPIEIRPVEKSEVKVGAATGWSVKEDEVEAVNEAVSMMLGKLKSTPDIVFLYPSTAYQKEKVVKEVRRLLPETKLLGDTAPAGVITDAGYFLDRPQSMAILGVSIPEVTWGVGAASIEKIPPREAAKEALLEAIADAGREVTEKPNFIILAPTIGTEIESLKGIAEVVGEKVPVFGAHAADVHVEGGKVTDVLLHSEKVGTFAGDEIYTAGISLAVVYTDLKAVTYLEHGFEITEKGGKITKAEGPRLIEIDNRPAAEVYNEWLGGALDAEVKNPEKARTADIVYKTVPNWLAKKTKTLAGEDYYFTTMPVAILPDLSLILEIEVEEGDEIYLARGDWEILLNRLITVPQKAIRRFDLKKENIIFALNSFCGATWSLIPLEERPKMPLLLKESLGEKVPFISLISCGIPIFIPELGRNTQTALSEGVLIFSR